MVRLRLPAFGLVEAARLRGGFGLIFVSAVAVTTAGGATGAGGITGAGVVGLAGASTFGSITGWLSDAVSARTASIAFFTSAISVSRIASSN